MPRSEALSGCRTNSAQTNASIGFARHLENDRGRTTRPVPEMGRPRDPVDRKFTASRPNELWMADISYLKTFSGWVYFAFALDVHSRMIAGWQVSMVWPGLSFDLYTRIGTPWPNHRELAATSRGHGTQEGPRDPQGCEHFFAQEPGRPRTK